MCVVCIELAKEKMTNKEALGAIGEMLSISKTKKDSKHLMDLVDAIMEAEVPQIERDDNIEKLAIDLVQDKKREKYGTS